MKSTVDEARVRRTNRQFHDDVEAYVYDQRMGVRHDKESVANLIRELEWVLGCRLPAATHVVDLGAGTGNLAIKLALDGRFKKVTAVDISRGMLNQTEISARRHDCHVDTIVSDMRELPFADDSVDLIVGCAILHHMPSPAKLLHEVHRILRPGSPAIFIGEPSKWGERMTHLVKLPLLLPIRCHRCIAGRRPTWEHDLIDVHTFSLRDIREITETFTQVRIRSLGFLEPIVDQGLLVPSQRLVGKVSAVRWGCANLRRLLRRFDNVLFNRCLPAELLVSVKFACWK